MSEEGGPTLQLSKLSRIAQSLAAVDLRGGKASEALSTVERSNLAVEYAGDFRSDSSFDEMASMWMGPRATRLSASSSEAVIEMV